MTVENKNHFNVFYSWQSDINNKANNYFIKDCIEKAIKELKKEADIITPRLDKDTQGESGSPIITETILKKIDASDMFIADVTIINSNWLKILKKRLTPNPNVLFELGYALHRLTWNRIICLNNNSFSDISDMPFDLQQNRISQYTFNGKENKKKAKHELTTLLKVAIKAVIDNNEALLAEAQKTNIQQHDIKQFQDFSKIIDESTFCDKLQHIANNQIIRNEYELFRELTEYLKAEGNQFLVPELRKAALELNDAIENMHSTLATTLQSKTEFSADVKSGETESHRIYQLPESEAHFESFQEYEKDRNNRIDRNTNAISATIDSYKKFRSLVKQHLFI